MKIFIDFDDVLFNTQRFKADFENIFLQFGVARDVFEENYYNYPPNKKEYPGRTYILEKHLEKISKIISFDKITLKKSIQKFIGDTRKYVFSDVKYFLHKFSRRELFLISHGDKNFQLKKINNSKIGGYFSEVKISAGLKSQSFIPLIKKEEETKFFLDDRVHYLEEVKKCLPEIITILIQRPEGRYHDQKNEHCDFTAKNLKEALKIISKLQKG